MDKAAFVATTDIEIGDNVAVILPEGHGYSPGYKVYDIRTIHELRNKKVYFEFKLTYGHEEYTTWTKRNMIIRLEKLNT